MNKLGAYSGKVQKTIYKNADTLVRVCGAVKKSDRVLVAADEALKEEGEVLAASARQVTNKVEFLTMPHRGMHGMEPPPEVAAAMLRANLILGVSKSSMAHTEARVAATNAGARYLSLADYSFDQLSRPSLGIDFYRWAEVAKNIADILDVGREIRVRTSGGTNLKIYCEGRKANCCPGLTLGPGTMGSPPDIETNISPLETKSEGVFVVDGSIPCKEIGLLKKPLVLKIAGGMIADIDDNNPQGKILKDIFAKQPQNAKVLAEFGIGLNPKAELCGLMLEDEGCLGTIHCGFGSNYTVGGKNKVNFHLDFVMRKPTVEVDGKLLMKDGRLVRSVLGRR